MCQTRPRRTEKKGEDDYQASKVLGGGKQAQMTIEQGQGQLAFARERGEGEGRCASLEVERGSGSVPFWLGVADVFFGRKGRGGRK